MKNDTVKNRVRSAIFKHRKSNPLWYFKNRRTINIKLRQSIMDVLPDLDKKTADLILFTIFDSIAEDLAKGNRTMIQEFGAFTGRKYPGRWRNVGRTPKKWRLQYYPPRVGAKFKPCIGLHRSVQPEGVKEEDA